jgi:hypothetical protein
MIKRLLLTVLLAVPCLVALAQFDGQNSLVRKALVSYSKDSKGFWHSVEDVLVDKIDEGGNVYAFEKKTGCAYVRTDDANYQIVLTKEFAKIYKSSKLAPIVEGQVLEDMIRQNSEILAKRYQALNDERQKAIDDAAKKVRDDSIARVRHDSIQRVLEHNQLLQYRRETDWHQLPTRNTPLVCTICGHHAIDETVYCLGIVRDSIYYQEEAIGINKDVYPVIHVSMYNRQLNNVEEYQYHTRVFADSLSSPKYLCYEYAIAENERAFAEYLKTLSEQIPYGYVESWGYDIQDGHLVLDFAYTNTTARPIKSVDVSYKLLDATGKVLKVNHLRSTTPLEPFHTQKWSWNEEQKTVPSTATDLKIHKVTLFFKDGRQHTVTKDLLVKEN